MDILPSYQALADAVLALHVAVVAFVVLGLAAVPIGNAAGWAWVNDRRFRVLHGLVVGVVVLQAWLGRYCGLTVLESWLRRQAGQAPYESSFVGHWLARLLYYDAPLWVFAVAYTVFGLLVAWVWWRFPPRAGRGR